MPLLDLFFPPRCYGCDDYLTANETRAGVCGPCSHTVHCVRSPLCPRCSLPHEIADGTEGLCPECLDAPPAFEAAHACWVYDGAVRDAIRSAKSQDDPAPLAALCRATGERFAQIVAALPAATWTTMPPHPVDLRRRGWDPPGTALRLLARAGRIRLRPQTLLKKTARTRKQASLTRAQRRVAPHGAFAAARQMPACVILFDDVMTTGATAHHAACALREAGAQQVIVVALARAV